MIRGIHHIALNTRNFDRLLAFYTNVIGFEPASDEYRWENSKPTDQATGLSDSAARHIWLKAGNCFIELFEYEKPKGTDNPPLRPHDQGYTHFALDVTDIEAEYDRLKAAGMVFAHERPVDFGAIQAVYGKDPDGNTIELQQIDDDQGASLSRLGLMKW